MLSQPCVVVVVAASASAATTAAVIADGGGGGRGGVQRSYVGEGDLVVALMLVGGEAVLIT